MAELLNRSQYAKYRGVSPEAVRKAIESGRITLIDGKIDPEIADIQWRNNTNHVKAMAANGGRMNRAMDEKMTGGLPNTPAVEDYMHWKTRRERAQAISAEQEQERSAGNLYYKEDVDRGAKTVARLLRDQLLSVPARLAAELANIDDAAQIEQEMRRELRSVLLAIDQLISKNHNGVEHEA